MGGEDGGCVVGPSQTGGVLVGGPAIVHAHLVPLQSQFSPEGRRPGGGVVGEGQGAVEPVSTQEHV